MILGEDDTHNSSLGSLISSFFDMSEADLDPDVAEEIKRLRTLVEKANKDVQKQSDEILSAVVNSSIGFGYPNIEELNLFYVCCSRPKKRLFFFVTVPIETAFRAFLVTLVGEENILTYEQFIKMVH